MSVRSWFSSHGSTFLRYSLSGVMAFVVDLAITLALATRWYYLIANSVGFIVANLLQFVVAHRWVFRRPFERDSLARFYSGTLTISLIGIVCSNVLVFLGVDVASMPLALAKAVSAIVVLFINYSLRVVVLYRPIRPGR
jgi:putative flippase GtrA